MLSHLSIKNFAIVAALDLELHNGMTVITGETGAGKSIILDALGLTLGNRSGTDSIREGCNKAEIIATFDLTHLSAAKEWLADNDLQDENLCILRRVISKEGRSRAYINGTPYPLSAVRQLGEMLINIHSQHEHQALVQKEHQRQLLDEYAGARELSLTLHSLWQEWRQLCQAQERIIAEQTEQNARTQLLQYQVEELAALALEPGEVEQLEQEQKQLSSAESTLLKCHQVQELCYSNESGNVLSMLRQSEQLLMELEELPALQEVSELLTSAQIQIDEMVGNLGHFISNFEADPERLQQVEERLSTLYQVARKHRTQPEELPLLYQQLQAELEALNSSDEQLEQLKNREKELVAQYQDKVAELTPLRQQAAHNLSKEVTARMQTLGMAGGSFKIDLNPITKEALSPYGLEDIEFIVSCNPGQTLRPLNKVASGGELSRLCLAIQIITSQTANIPTLVFDEVDVGIGGGTAERVGCLLQELGLREQVLCITHQPQVAARGHNHLHVSKLRGDERTISQIKPLTVSERTHEVARMLGGIKITRQTLSHAREMMRLAHPTSKQNNKTA